MQSSTHRLFKHLIFSYVLQICGRSWLLLRSNKAACAISLNLLYRDLHVCLELQVVWKSKYKWLKHTHWDILWRTALAQMKDNFVCPKEMLTHNTKYFWENLDHDISPSLQGAMGDDWTWSGRELGVGSKARGFSVAHLSPFKDN